MQRPAMQSWAEHRAPPQNARWAEGGGAGAGRRQGLRWGAGGGWREWLLESDPLESRSSESQMSCAILDKLR